MKKFLMVNDKQYRLVDMCEDEFNLTRISGNNKNLYNDYKKARNMHELSEFSTEDLENATIILEKDGGEIFVPTEVKQGIISINEFYANLNETSTEEEFDYIDIQKLRDMNASLHEENKELYRINTLLGAEVEKSRSNPPNDATDGFKLDLEELSSDIEQSLKN